MKPPHNIGDLVMIRYMPDRIFSLGTTEPTVSGFLRLDNSEGCYGWYSPDDLVRLRLEDDEAEHAADRKGEP